MRSKRGTWIRAALGPGRFAFVLTLLASAAARAESRRLTLDEAVALGEGTRGEAAVAALDQALAHLELVRAGLGRARLTLEGRASDQVEQLYVNAPPALCASIDSLCRPLTHARLVDLSASLTVPLWTGLGLEAEWARARAREREARATRAGVERVIRLQVSTAYWTVRGTELLQAAAARALARRQQLARSIQERAEAGIVPRTDANRAQTAVLRAQAALAERQGRALEARASLSSALQTEGDLVLVDDPQPTAAQSALVALGEGRGGQTVATLVERGRGRPELAAAAASIDVEAQTVRMHRGALWPQLSLFGRADARNEAFGVPQPRLISDVSAGITLSWLAFDGLTTYQAMRAAELERDKRIAAQARLSAEVTAEVRSAHARLVAALDRHAPLSEACALARTTLDQVRRRYQAGTTLLIEMLEVEDELSQLDSDLVDNEIEIEIARAALTAALGVS